MEYNPYTHGQNSQFQAHSDHTWPAQPSLAGWAAHGQGQPGYDGEQSSPATQHQMFMNSGSYNAGVRTQPNVLPNTLATDALDLATSMHAQQPAPTHYSTTMSSGYGHTISPPHLSATYAQPQYHHQGQTHPRGNPVMQQSGQASHAESFPAGHPSTSQQNLLARRFASMPQRAQQSQPRQASSPRSLSGGSSGGGYHDVNAEMNALLNGSVPSFVLSPEQSPTMERPPQQVFSSPPTSTTTAGFKTNEKVPAKSKAPRKTKKRKIPEPEEVDDDDDDAEEVVGKGPSKPHACRRCKTQKIKCVPLPGENMCQKCKQTNQPCLFDKRKPPRNPNKREYFMAQIREKDAIIESLLREKYDPYNSTPLSVKTFQETAQPGADAWGFLTKIQDGSKRPTYNATRLFRDPSANIHSSDGEDADKSEEEEVEESGSNARPVKESSLDDAFPIALLEDLHVSHRRRTKSASSNEHTAVEDNETVGITNKRYFGSRPMPMVEQHNRSNLLMYGLVTEADVDTLFQLYHEKLNAFIPLLDPVLHTPEETFRRCPCLFTVICAITSRFDEEKKKIYGVAMHYAKNECADALMHGPKSIGLAQAFMLLAMYHNPAKRFEEERAYLYAGLATRIAIDLNLHIQPIMKPNRTEKEEREVLDKLRLWMICFETDWNMAAHYGKPWSVNENLIIRSSDDFWRRSQFNLVGDIGLSAYNKLLRTVSGFISTAYSDPNSRTGLNKSIDFRGLCDEYDVLLRGLEETWSQQFAAYTRFAKDEIYHFRCSLLPYAVNYCRLVMGCFGIQQTFEKGKQSPDRVFMAKCMTAASTVVECFINSLAPSGFMRFAPNGWFTFCSFACAFLIKLLRPEFSSILRPEEANAIISLVHRLAATLKSETVAIDKQHSPSLWARFLEDLLTKKQPNAGVTQGSQEQTPIAVPSATYQTEAYPAASTSTYPAGSYAHSAYPVDMPQWTAMQAHNMAASQQRMHPASAVPTYGLPSQGYAIGQGQEYFPQTAYPMTLDDDASMAIMSAVAPDAIFWDSMMMPGHGVGWMESPPSQQLDMHEATAVVGVTGMAPSQWMPPQ